MFTKKDNLKHWESIKEELTHSDMQIIELEKYFILSQLKKIRPNKLLDIGCGSGIMTEQYSKFAQSTLGIDYSKNMIEKAKKRTKKHLHFDCVDVQKVEGKYDVIISNRCIINQPTLRDQLQVFCKIYDLLHDNGSFIICEESEEGIQRINKLRKKYGLKQLNTQKFNKQISEKDLFPLIRSRFEIIDLQRAGLYYFLTRLVHPTIVYPADPDPKAKINKLSLEFQKQFSTVFEDYGVLLLIHFKKLPIPGFEKSTKIPI